MESKGIYITVSVGAGCRGYVFCKQFWHKQRVVMEVARLGLLFHAAAMESSGLLGSLIDRHPTPCCTDYTYTNDNNTNTNNELKIGSGKGQSQLGAYLAYTALISRAPGNALYLLARKS